MNACEQEHKYSCPEPSSRYIRFNPNFEYRFFYNLVFSIQSYCLEQATKYLKRIKICCLYLKESDTSKVILQISLNQTLLYIGIVRSRIRSVDGKNSHIL